MAIKTGSVQNFRFSEYQCIVDISFWDEVIKLKLSEWKLDCPVMPLKAFLQPPNVLRIDSHSLPNAHPAASSSGDYVCGFFHHTNSLEEFLTAPFNEFALESITPLQDAIARNLIGQPRLIKDVIKVAAPVTIVAFMDLKEYIMRYAVSIGTVGLLKFDLLPDKKISADQAGDKTGVDATTPVRSTINEEAEEADNRMHKPWEELRLKNHASLGLHGRNLMLALCPLDGREFVVHIAEGAGSWQHLKFRANRGGDLDSGSMITSPVIANWLKRKTSISEGENVCAHQIPQQCIFQLDLKSFLSSEVVQQNATELNVRLIKWRIIPEFDPEQLRRLRVLVVGVGTLGCFICRELIGWGVCNFTLIDCGVVSPSNPVRQCLYKSADVGLNSNRNSNAVRNSKVHIAKSRLLEIRPDLNIEAFDWEIPMPNQSRFNLPVKNFVPDTTEPEASEVYSEWVTKRLLQLVEDNDIFWLLTDNRESRWLPSLICQYQSYKMSKEQSRNRQRASSQTGDVSRRMSGDASTIVPTGAAQTRCQSASEHMSRPCLLTTTTAAASCVDRSTSTQRAVPDVDYYRKKNAFKPALCYTVALGFDTFVAMRHGSYSDCSVTEEYKDLDSAYDVFGSRLSCYFCNDLSAPAGGFGRRALDQQCTVTRNGVAAWAAALAVECMAALTQSDYAWGAAPPDRLKEAKNRIDNSLNGSSPPVDGGEDSSSQKLERRNTFIRKWLIENPRHKSCLGETPHVIRGSLSNFTLAHNWHPAFPHCVCCSEGVLQTFDKYKTQFIASVVQDSTHLEEVSGINQFRCQTVIKDDVVLSFTNIVESDVD